MDCRRRRSKPSLFRSTGTYYKIACICNILLLWIDAYGLQPISLPAYKYNRYIAIVSVHVIVDLKLYEKTLELTIARPLYLACWFHWQVTVHLLQVSKATYAVYSSTKAIWSGFKRKLPLCSKAKMQSKRTIAPAGNRTPITSLEGRYSAIIPLALARYFLRKLLFYFYC